jgi:hypothetical protein
MEQTEFKEPDASSRPRATGEPSTSTLLLRFFPPLKACYTIDLPLAIAATVTSLGIAMRGGYLWGRSPSEQFVCVAWPVAAVHSRHCVGRCGALSARLARLTAELGALTTEANEAKRREAAEDRKVALADDLRRARDLLRYDPVTSLLAG